MVGAGERLRVEMPDEGDLQMPEPTRLSRSDQASVIEAAEGLPGGAVNAR
jgi:hypothetical protein